MVLLTKLKKVFTAHALLPYSEILIHLELK